MIYLERTKGISSTQIRQETFDHYDIGIVCDIADDNRIIEEAKLLSGFEVKNVYFDDETISEDFQKKYDVENVCGTFDELMDSSDIIYLRCCLEKRKDYITKAMNAKKHVVYDPPATIDPDELEKLFRLAQENNVILMQNIKMVYIYIFNQLLWMTQAGLIGDLLSFNCSISKMDEGRSNLFYDLSVFCLLPMLKIMGQDYVKSDFKVTKNEDVIEFASMYFDYPKGISVINVGNNIRVNNQLEIIGTEGTIRMEGDWWKSKRFEIHTPGLRDVQVFSTNFDGDGFKYLIKELSRMLATNRINTKTILNDESLKMVEIFKEISEKK
jgi:predicted dehydrogenase